MTNILFLCTGNSARSILAEVMVNQVMTRPGIQAFSAGSQPTGTVNPGAIKELQSRGYSTQELASKSWDTFTHKDGPAIDWVITLCDSAANEVCPIFPGACNKAHWGLPDPATDAATFPDTFDAIAQKVAQFYKDLS